jgi:hypothetical protein
MGPTRWNGEAKPKKLSLKFKLFVYIGWNVATFLLAVINIIQSYPADATVAVLTYLGNVAIMNFIFWYAFRARDRRAQDS